MVMPVSLATRTKAKTAAPERAVAQHKPEVADTLSSTDSFDSHVFTVLPIIQPKLKISNPNDKYEQEADRVADEVMRRPEFQVQRQVEPMDAGLALQRMSAEEEEEMVQAKPAVGIVQRKCSTCEEEEPLQRMVLGKEEEEETLQTKSEGERVPAVTSRIQSGISQVRQRSSTALPTSTRAFMEPRFGQDFGHVKIHTGDQAATLAKQINARAFTVGRDIFFNQGEFQPHTASGKQLLAHELAHTLQQTGTLQTERINRVEAPTLSGSAGSSCPLPPDPMGEWRTEPWLCQMRRSAIGDNRYLLAAKGQRGAKDDAQGRSVELVHQVLALWLCENPELAARHSRPLGDLYTSATADIVRAFQDKFHIPIDGIVGPETLSIMDYYINGKPVPSPPDCTGRSEVCGPRDTDEIADSATDNLVLSEGGMKPISADSAQQLISLSGFTVDEASLSKGPRKTLDRLGEILNPATFQPKKRGALTECWQIESAEVFGFADCHEVPTLAVLRAEATRDEFFDAGLIVGVAPNSPFGNLDAAQRRGNRSVMISLTFKLGDRFDFSGNDLDALLLEFKRQRKELSKQYEDLVIEVAALLAEDARDDYLDIPGAEFVANQKFPSGCLLDIPWESAMLDLGRLINVELDAESACESGTLPSIDEFMQAVADGVVTPMSKGINKLSYEAARAAIASSFAGCACVSLKQLLLRSKDKADIYYAFRQELSDIISSGDDCGT